jgi:hypothetical protein
MSSVSLATLALLEVAVEIRDRNIRMMAKRVLSVDTRGDWVRHVPLITFDLSVVLECHLSPLVFSQGFSRRKPDLLNQESTGGRDDQEVVNLPIFITDMDLTGKKWFVSHVLSTEVADGAQQFILLHVAAPETFDQFPIDHLDEERVNALRCRSVALPELGRRNRHESIRLVGAGIRLEIIADEILRAANGSDELPHRFLDLRVFIEVPEAKRLILSILGLDLRFSVFWRL